MDGGRLWRRSTRKYKETCRGRRWDDGNRSEEGYPVAVWGGFVRQCPFTQGRPCVHFAGSATPATATATPINQEGARPG